MAAAKGRGARARHSLPRWRSFRPEIDSDQHAEEPPGPRWWTVIECYDFLSPMTQPAGNTAARPKQPIYKILYFQVLIAIVLGVAVGFLFPDFGAGLKPLGDGFIKLIKMVIA